MSDVAGSDPGLAPASAPGADSPVFGIMTGFAIRYWFPAPSLFVAVAFLCFLAALMAPGGSVVREPGSPVRP